MRLGIGSYTYVWSIGVPGFPLPAAPLTPESLLERAVASGIGVVQIADNMPFHEWSIQRLKSLSTQAQAANIQLELGTSGIAPPHLRQTLELAQTLNAKVVRVVVDVPNHHPAPQEVAESIVQVLPEFAAAKTQLAIENHDRFSARLLKSIIEQINSEWVGICLDTANSLGCGEGLETVLEQLAPFVVNLHVKDFTVQRLPSLKGFTVEGCAAGQGLVDVPALLKKLHSHGRNPNVIVELWPPFVESIEESIGLELRWADQSLTYMRQFITD
jgi:sugar phosphate isomerase/epimerase